MTLESLLRGLKEENKDFDKNFFNVSIFHAVRSLSGNISKVTARTL